jgi:hypothetical protein
LAKSDSPKDLQKALVSGKFMDWSGEVKFEEPNSVKWHNVSPPHLVLQQTEVRQDFTKSSWYGRRSSAGTEKSSIHKAACHPMPAGVRVTAARAGSSTWGE